MDVSQEAKERMQYREKNKKKLAFTIIGGAILLGGVACAVALPLMYCKPTPDEKVIEINATNVTNYLIDANTQIYIEQSSSGAFGHKLLDLKKLSDDNDNITHFVITENIDFGFLVNPDMDCHLSAKNNAIVNCVASSDEAVGVIIGSVEPCSGIYTKNLIIDQTTTFTISSASSACGVIFYSTAANSTQTISGTFTIISSASSAYGVFFSFIADSNITVSGTFTISSTFTVALGVYLSAAISGNITISGTFIISSTSTGDAVGVAFVSTAAGSTQTISGTFTISADDGIASGVVFASTDANSTQTISGTFTISSASSRAARGVNFSGSTIAGNATISGIFTIFSAVSSGACGVNFEYTTAGSLTMTGTQFFSNRVDSGNIFTRYPSSDEDHNYKWNGTEMTYENHNSSADNSLTLMDVPDQTQNPNFTIKVIDTAGVDGSKATFNTAYKNALNTYVASVDCPTTAKPWLVSIIGQIPTT